MAEYINKRDALKIMRDAWDICENGDFAIAEAINCVESLPAADVVERRSCNTCQHYDGVHHATGHAPCSFWKIGCVMWNDFCSRWEKENG